MIATHRYTQLFTSICTYLHTSHTYFCGMRLCVVCDVSLSCFCTIVAHMAYAVADEPCGVRQHSSRPFEGKAQSVNGRAMSIAQPTDLDDARRVNELLFALDIRLMSTRLMICYHLPLQVSRFTCSSDVALVSFRFRYMVHARLCRLFTTSTRQVEASIASARTRCQ